MKKGERTLATWIAHLRVAENLINKRLNLKVEPFVVGNIGPDSGVPNEDWSEFTPSTDITHWKEGKTINPENFREKYLDKVMNEVNSDRYSFYLGYYVHLLTDVKWTEFFNYKKEDSLHKEGFERDKNFIWVIKKDWYGLDYLYLDKNPKSIFFTCFKNVTSVPDYLDYFPKGAFTRQVKYISDFYLGENEETKQNFIYLTEFEMNKFVKDAGESICNHLKDMNIKHI